MNGLHTDFNQALDKIIALKLERYEITVNEKISKLERKLKALNTQPNHEILMQKEVFELLDIGRRRLKNWVERGLKELRIDHRVYYRYSDLIECIENSKS